MHVFYYHHWRQIDNILTICISGVVFWFYEVKAKFLEIAIPIQISLYEFLHTIWHFLRGQKVIIWHLTFAKKSDW